MTYTTAQLLNRTMIQTMKSNPCAECGVEYHWSAMQWDHLPGTDKRFNPSRAWKEHGRPAILEEIAKCDLVCANCHAIRGYVRSNGL